MDETVLVMRKYSGALVLLLCLAVMPLRVMAAGCYTDEQFRAEQAVRFHTQLMVMGLYCKAVLKQDTYAAYQDFTRRNQNIIKSEEDRLIAYYRNNGAKRADRALHTMRTDLANNISIQAGASPVAFCRRYANHYEQAKTMIPVDFRRWIEGINITSTLASSAPLCAAPQKGK